jgi:adenosylhomocysteine nucleosidase
MTWRAAAVALVILMAVGCASAPPRVARPMDPPPAPAQPIAVDVVVQGAVDSELQPLLEALEGSERIQLAAWTFWRGHIGGKDVVISRTEVGPINASVATALAIEHFHPRLIINQGTAGAVDPALNVFDIVVGSATVDYGAFRSTHADLGAGVDLARWTPSPHRMRIDGGDRIEFRKFPGDPAAVARAAAHPNPRGRVSIGTIGSAYEFNKELDKLSWTRKAFGIDTEDMESAYAAGAAIGFKTPFVAIRVISDNEFTAPEFKPIAGQYCAEFVVAMLRQ